MVAHLDETPEDPIEGEISPQIANLRTALGARLRGHRIHRNMTGVALSSAAGISGAMLSKIESAERIPSLPVLVALAAALGVEVGDLFGSSAGLTEPVLVRAGQPLSTRKVDDDDLVQIEQLGVMELPEVQIRLLRMRAAKGCKTMKPVQFDGFWIDHIVKGELVVCIGEREYHLRAGDTMTYRGEVPHYGRFPGGATEVLAVQGWINTNAQRRIKLDGALLSPGQR
ncbi:XRE family transcriptional regulator [Roseateles toxinivorans]|uniref:XRE family transcriptional regulator n=2 Tax=Roseateles toxinivorans TaxID=270368 RepID=A0A4R6QDS5_9BURK|nr:XRE family transcriptional regulator [Roseateles toxinivorans]